MKNVPKITSVVLFVILFRLNSWANHPIPDSTGTVIIDTDSLDLAPGGSTILNMQELTGWPQEDPDQYDRYGSATAICADIDGNGLDYELVTASWRGDPGNIIVHCFKSDGSELPGWPISINDILPWDTFSPAVGDIDNDGHLDIVFSAGRELWAVDASGQLKSGWPYIHPDSFLFGTPSLGDLNSDGYLEVGVTIFTAGSFVIDHLGVPLPNFSPAGNINQGGGICSFADIDCDGNMDFITGSAWFNNQGVLQNQFRSWPPWALTQFTNVACADINGDNNLEIVIPYENFADGYCQLNAYLSDGTNFWYYAIPEFDPYPYAGCAIADLNFDGDPEIIWVPSDVHDGRVYGFKKDGADYFSPNPKNIDHSGGTRLYKDFSNPTCGRINSSGTQNIVINWRAAGSSEDHGLITALSSTGDEILPLTTTLAHGIATSPTLCDFDLDQNNYTNIFAGEGWYESYIHNQQASFHIFAPTIQPFNPRFVDWATLGKNRQHTGVYEQPVGGTLAHDTWWYGTYKVFSDIIVPNGISLTINAGSLVRMNYGKKIIIQSGGNLVVKGTQLDSVYFTYYTPNPQAGSWQGIQLQSGAEAEINYAVIEYATNGIYASTGSTMSISSCAFKDCANSGLYASSCNPTILHSTFQNCGNYGAFLTGGNLVFDYNNVFGKVKYGIKYAGNGTILIDHTAITSTDPGSYWGIYIGQSSPSDRPSPGFSNDSITCFAQGGIYISGSYTNGSISPNVRCKKNTMYGLYLKNSSPPVDGRSAEEHNSFIGNKYAIYCDVGCNSVFRWNNIIKDDYGVLIASGAYPDFGTTDSHGNNTIVITPAVGTYEMRNNNTMNPINAKYNWWDTNGPQVVGSVNYTPQSPINPIPYNERREAPGMTRPSELTLDNYPNPFNPNTEIRFVLPQAGVVNIQVYDITGRMVRNLLSGSYEAGDHTVIWDGTDASGNKVSSGMYFCTISTSQSRATKKMLLLK